MISSFSFKKHFTPLIKNAIPKSICQHRLSNSDCLLLTFDDGPHTEHTPKVLDLLDEHSAKALFFIASERIKDSQDLLKDIVDRGHSLQNHSANHLPCSELSFAQIKQEINNCHQRIFDLTGQKTKYFRPPFGIITPKTIIASKRANHDLLCWSFDTGEYNHFKDASADVIASNLVEKVKPSEIVLSHDDSAKMPEILAHALPLLTEKRFNLKDGINEFL